MLPKRDAAVVAAPPPTAKERLLFAYMKLVGETVELKRKDGVVFTGLFISADTSARAKGVILAYPKITGAVPEDADKPELGSPGQDNLIVDWDDIAFLVARQVPRGKETLVSSSSSASRTSSRPSQFSTDTAITGDRGKRSFSRKLENAATAGWLDAKDSKAPGGDDEAVNDMSSGDGKWDQFKVNREKFGVKETYHESIYTTELPETITPEMRKRAEAMAKSIQSQTTTNPHLAEERGQKSLSDGWDDDEEAKYGAVVGSGAYAKDQKATPSAWGASKARAKSSGGSSGKAPQGAAASKSKPPPGLVRSDEATTKSEPKKVAKLAAAKNAGVGGAWGGKGSGKKTFAEMVNGNAQSLSSITRKTPPRVNRVMAPEGEIAQKTGKTSEGTIADVSSRNRRATIEKFKTFSLNIEKKFPRKKRGDSTEGAPSQKADADSDESPQADTKKKLSAGAKVWKPNTAAKAFVPGGAVPAAHQGIPIPGGVPAVAGAPRPIYLPRGQLPHGAPVPIGIAPGGMPMHLYTAVPPQPYVMGQYPVPVMPGGQFAPVILSQGGYPRGMHIVPRPGIPGQRMPMPMQQGGHYRGHRNSGTSRGRGGKGGRYGGNRSRPRDHSRGGKQQHQSPPSASSASAPSSEVSPPDAKPTQSKTDDVAPSSDGVSPAATLGTPEAAPANALDASTETTASS